MEESVADQPVKSKLRITCLAVFSILAASRDLAPGAPSPASLSPQRFDAWQILGPGGGGAQFYPAVSPHNPDVVLVACDMTGAYISEDAGNSWRMFNLRVPVTFFAFDPIDRQ